MYQSRYPQISQKSGYSDFRIFGNFQIKANHKISYSIKTNQLPNITNFQDICFVPTPTKRPHILLFLFYFLTKTLFSFWTKKQTYKRIREVLKLESKQKSQTRKYWVFLFFFFSSSQFRF